MRHPDDGDCADYNDGDYEGYEEAIQRQWNNAKNHRYHTCEGCGVTFGAHYGRGALAYCDGCADMIEQGMDF